MPPTKRARQASIDALTELIRSTPISHTLSSSNTICTHSGTFHCDEALAVSMMKSLPEFSKNPILRTRDADLISQCKIVVDVGAVYDSSAMRFDHHQRGFEEVFNGKSKTKLSSAGLVYKHFGVRVVAEILGWDLGCQEVKLVHEKVYKEFVEHVDGIDNGVDQYEDCGKKRYSSATNLSARVSFLNPEWNEENVEENERFKSAVILTGTEFIQAVHRVAFSWLPARTIVEDTVSKRFDVHSSGLILKFTQYCPWKSHLHDLEDEVEGLKPLYVLYPEDNGAWRVQCCNDRGNEFNSRKPLPERLRGLRDEVLSKAADVPGCVFIHAAGFIGGAKSYESALRLAEMALQE